MFDVSLIERGLPGVLLGQPLLKHDSFNSQPESYMYTTNAVSLI